MAKEQEAAAEEAVENDDVVAEANEADTGDADEQQDDTADEADGEGDAGKKAAADKAKEKGKDADKKVPLGALHESRAREREAKARAEQAERRAERMEQRFQQMLDRQNKGGDDKAQKNDDPEPDFEKSPAEWLRWDGRRKDKRIEELSTWRKRQEQGGQQSVQARNADRELSRAVSVSEAEFTEETPDYPDALKHAQDARLRYFRAAGMTPEEAQQTLFEETKYVARMALRAGASPAERIYAIAKELGYKAKGTGVGDKIKQMQNGQRGSSRLAGGGGDGDGDVSLKRLAELDDAEFDKEWEKLQKAGKLG